MDLVNQFLNGLRAALPAEELEDLNTAHGATQEDINTLKSQYPDCPESLIRLLENIEFRSLSTLASLTWMWERHLF